MSSPLYLGIDTGGTYTDAVLFNDTDGVIAKAKSLTTRHDLAVGIGGAVSNVLQESRAPASAIALVSLSTTLATNALVEGQGGRAALVMIGFGPNDLKRDGLGDALGRDPVIFLAGGHNVHGQENSLDLGPLVTGLDALKTDVDAIAIAGYFAVRNPSHEMAARDLIRDRTGLPVTCSHELSSKLGGPRRALTTLLNARLVAMIDRLIGATESYLKTCGIDAPLMVVRGDGALIASQMSRSRPIETILSGPAASLVGAHHLTGAENGVVSDIGGTTTDVAVLEGGRPQLDPDGAIVGGFRTMVEAVAMRTFGLGGDSEVHVDESGLETRLSLGPRRLVPLSLAAHHDPDSVLEALSRQQQGQQPGRLDARFVRLTGLPEQAAAGLQPQEAALLGTLGTGFLPLDQILGAASQRATLDRLVARGLAQIAGFTPTDAMHVLNRQNNWNRDAAMAGAALLARRKNGAGKRVANRPETLAQMTIDRLTRQSAEMILTACLAEDGQASIDPGRSQPIASALTRRAGIVQFSLSLDRPLIGLGASAAAYYPDIADMLSSDSAVPTHADVANAIGAVVGQVRVTIDVVVSQPEDDIFAVNGAQLSERHLEESKAMDRAREIARAAALDASMAAGAMDPIVTLSETIDAPEIGGTRQFVEARVSATASGRPRIAHR
ncbi:MAG: hydantoinase/oxoprolinase family protein [Alphaproteobacteria bacterium]|nr:hydantoinase/oxoprolinase family protein [Alphaproteobacteria bacterium]